MQILYILHIWNLIKKILILPNKLESKLIESFVYLEKFSTVLIFNSIRSYYE